MNENVANEMLRFSISTDFLLRKVCEKVETMQRSKEVLTETIYCSKGKANFGIAEEEISSQRSIAVPNLNSDKKGKIPMNSDSQLRPSILLRYVGSDPIYLTGPITGKSYSFVSAHDILSVDAQDAAFLTRTESFRKA